MVVGKNANIDGGAFKSLRIPLMSRMSKQKVAAVLALFVVGLFIFSGSEGSIFATAFSILAESPTPPQIIYADVDPDKVVPGDNMLVEVHVIDDYGVESVLANMADLETIELRLVSGDDKDGIWQGVWHVFGTQEGLYTTYITATNIEGGFVVGQIEWTDDPDYKFQLPIKITNVPEELRDYVVNVTLDTKALIARRPLPDNNRSLAGKMEFDCRDIIFWDQSHERILNHWMANHSQCNTTSTEYFVEIPVIQNGGKTIYAVYGDSVAVNQSNFTKTRNSPLKQGHATVWNPTGGDDRGFSACERGDYYYIVGDTTSGDGVWYVQKRFKVNGSQVDTYSSDPSTSDDELHGCAFMHDGTEHRLFLYGAYYSSNWQFRVEKIDVDTMASAGSFNYNPGTSTDTLFGGTAGATYTWGFGRYHDGSNYRAAILRTTTAPAYSSWNNWEYSTQHNYLYGGTFDFDENALYTTGYETLSTDEMILGKWNTGMSLIASTAWNSGNTYSYDVCSMRNSTGYTNVYVTGIANGNFFIRQYNEDLLYIRMYTGTSGTGYKIDCAHFEGEPLVVVAHQWSSGTNQINVSSFSEDLELMDTTIVSYDQSGHNYLEPEGGGEIAIDDDYNFYFAGRDDASGNQLVGYRVDIFSNLNESTETTPLATPLAVPEYQKEESFLRIAETTLSNTFEIK